MQPFAITGVVQTHTDFQMSLHAITPMKHGYASMLVFLARQMSVPAVY